MTYCTPSAGRRAYPFIPGWTLHKHVLPSAAPGWGALSEGWEAPLLQTVAPGPAMLGLRMPLPVQQGGRAGPRQRFQVGDVLHPPLLCSPSLLLPGPSSEVKSTGFGVRQAGCTQGHGAQSLFLWFRLLRSVLTVLEELLYRPSPPLLGGRPLGGGGFSTNPGSSPLRTLTWAS